MTKRVYVSAFALSTILTLSSCSTNMPESTPVETGISMDKDSGDSATFQYYPASPTRDGSPQEIVRGFIEANTGFQNDFQVAREYLTADVAKSWSPLNDVQVYKGELTTSNPVEERVDVSFDMTKRVDSHGVMTTSEAPAQKLNFELVAEGGQWRIKNPPTGILLNEQNFNVLYLGYNLYFESGYQNTLTPDLRWFPQKTNAVSNIVRELINGPQAYLKDAVSNPLGTQKLSNDAVKVKSDGITVNLEGQNLVPAAPEVEQMNNQLKASLAPTVSSPTNVSLLQGGRELSSFAVDPQKDVPKQDVPFEQVGVVGSALSEWKDNKVTPLPGFKDVSALNPTRPALSLDGKVVSFFSGNNLYVMTAGQEPKAVSQGDYTDSSFDPTSRVWVAERKNTGKVTTFDPQGTEHEISAPWLAGKQVEDLKVSHDGTRIVVITREAEETRVFISGVVKGKDGLPESLNLPIQSDAVGVGDRVAWVGSGSVAIVTTNAPNVTPYVLEIGGNVTKLPNVSSMAGISAANKNDEVYVYNAQGQLFHQANNAWADTGTVLKDASFPG